MKSLIRNLQIEIDKDKGTIITGEVIIKRKKTFYSVPLRMYYNDPLDVPMVNSIIQQALYHAEEVNKNWMIAKNKKDFSPGEMDTFKYGRTTL